MKKNFASLQELHQSLPIISYISTVNTVRTVSDAKHAFYQNFQKPVTSIYRKVIDELLVEIHLLTVNQTFTYDSILAFGIATAFDRFTVGYQPETDRMTIFSALCHALLLNPEQVRREAEHLRELAMRSPHEIKNLLTTLESSANLDPLVGQLREIAANPKFKYSRLFGIGIFTLLEIADPELLANNEKQKELITQVSNTLKISSERLLKDLDLYRSNLEKVEQARQMMADLAEAERKKREKQAKKVDEPSESQESTSAEAS